MRKLIFLLPLLLLVSACSLSENTDSNKANDIIEKYEALNKLVADNTFTVDLSTTGKKTTYLSKNGDSLKTYSNIEVYASSFTNTNVVAEEYFDSESITIITDDNSFQSDYDVNEIWDFLGYQNIFNDAKNKTLSNDHISGSVDASSCPGIVRSFIVASGFFNDNYENYYFNSKINYTIYFDFTNEKIFSIELDLKDIAKLKKSTISEAYSLLTFVDDKDALEIVESHPVPDKNDGNNGGNSSEALIKQQGIDFIKDCYEDIEYVSDDLYFYVNTIVSPRLSFSYESNKPNVIGHDGTYYDVTNDTSVTITVSLAYQKEVYSTLTFDFLAIPKVTGTGTLGTKTNPLYKGRKAIDDVKINFIEMHRQYGDSIYIKAGDFDMLIDAGDSEDGGYVNDFLRRNVSDGRLECLVATHAHSDHIGGMTTALSTIKNITYAVDYGYQRSDYSLVANVRNLFKKADKYAPITDCIKETNGALKTLYITEDFSITFLDTGYYEEPSSDFGDDSSFNYNLTSVTFIMKYKNQKYYFAGDLESEGESILVDKRETEKVDLAKASHHGSTTSNSSKILSSLNPSIMVVSTALVDRGDETHNAKNQTHPIGNALREMLKRSKVYCNFTSGTVEVTCDGNSSLKVRGLGLTSPYYMNGVAVSGEENLEFKYTKWAKTYRNSFI